MIYRMIFVSFLLSLPAVAQTTKFYAPNGNTTGSERWEGSRLVQRDTRGNPQGYWMREGSEWVHRQNNGNVIGRAKTLP